MKKKYIALLVFAAIGIGLTVAGAAGMNFDLTGLTKEREFTTFTTEYEVEGVMIENLKIDVDASQVKIIDSSSNKIEVTYKSDAEILNFDGTTLNFKPKLSIKHWYNPFELFFANNYEITIGLPSSKDINFLKLDVDACDFSFTNTSLIQDMDIDVDASTFVMDNVNVANLMSEIDASEVNIRNNIFEELTLKASASSIDLKDIKVNDLKFAIDAGSLNARILGNKDDYFINIETSVGSCNLENTSSGDYSKSIEGTINAGSANIIFVS